jgi:hypothetical protein
MSSGGGPVSEASGGVASAIAACCRRADEHYPRDVGGSGMNWEAGETAFNTESTETQRVRRSPKLFLCVLRVSVCSVLSADSLQFRRPHEHQHIGKAAQFGARQTEGHPRRRQRSRRAGRGPGPPGHGRGVSDHAAVVPGRARRQADRRRPHGCRHRRCRRRALGALRAARRGTGRRAYLHRHLRPGPGLHVRALLPHFRHAPAHRHVHRHPRRHHPAVGVGRPPGRDDGARGGLGAGVLRDGAGSARHHHHGLQDRRAPRRDAAGECLPRRQLPVLRHLARRAARPDRGRRLHGRQERELARRPRSAAADGRRSADRRIVRQGPVDLRALPQGAVPRHAELALA